MPKRKIIRETTSNSSKAQRHFLLRLGPGLITGAADDDPSGIATYSQVGAQFGYGMLWTMLFSFPLMAAIQEICGRLGRITGKGIAANLREHYPRPLLYGLVTLLCVANVFNLGADVTAMGAAMQLIFKGPLVGYVIGFGVLSLLLQVFVPYKKYVRYLRWLTVVLFAYVITSFLAHVNWWSALRATFIPSFSWSRDYWMALVAVLGTTISPYLFFWQASEEAEDVRLSASEQPLSSQPSHANKELQRIASDTRLGMGFSNLVAFFVILTTAATLHAAGAGKEIETAADAAKALQPLAGQFASLLFAIGIIGTGLLAVPVLAGSAAYAVAESFQWRASLECKPREALKFYSVIVAATVLGVCLTFIGLNPIRALYWSAVINGIVAVPLMMILMIISTNKTVVGKFPVSPTLRLVGWGATVVMFLASLAFIVSAIAANLDS